MGCCGKSYHHPKIYYYTIIHFLSPVSHTHHIQYTQFLLNKVFVSVLVASLGAILVIVR